MIIQFPAERIPVLTWHLDWAKKVLKIEGAEVSSPDQKLTCGCGCHCRCHKRYYYYYSLARAHYAAVIFLLHLKT